MRLPEMKLVAGKQAALGSMIGSLDHLVAAVALWPKRFATRPADYPALERVHFTTFRALLIPNEHAPCRTRNI